MSPGPSTLTSYFANPHNKQNLAGSSSDADLSRAIELSETEAAVASLTEDELLQRAIEASRDDMLRTVKMTEQEDTENAMKRSRPTSSRSTFDISCPKIGKGVDSRPDSKKTKIEESHASPTSVALSEPSFTQESFSEKEEIVDRFNGSLDLLVSKGWIQRQERRQLREWMLRELKWHRVTYTAIRSKQKIVTPRFTTTFGKDDTGAPDTAYPVKPVPIPPVLDQLRRELERKTSARFNAIIINFYQDGKDSISYHADDESFLGPRPTIASISLGSSRDFYLRRKFGENGEPSAQQYYTKGSGPAASRPTEKMKLDDGDLIVMRGKTQAEWEHSIPKRANAGGRINLTFRKVVSVKGTNKVLVVDFQRYNRGLPTDDDTTTYRWDPKRHVMVPGTGGI